MGHTLRGCPDSNRLDKGNFVRTLEGLEVEFSRSKNELEKAPFLGIKGRTPASHEWRGLQTIDPSLKLVEEIDPETGEIFTYQDTKKGRKVYKTVQENRAERYALKSVVNAMFPKSETSKCSRAKVPGQSVIICKDPEHQKAFYTGLRRCGSVWWCPLCAAKIAERRRVELVAGVATAKAMGWHVYLMTCTVPHLSLIHISEPTRPY